MNHINNNHQFTEYEMSVILVTPDSLNTIRITLETLRRQTVNNSLELVIVCPHENDLGLPQSAFDVFCGFQILEIGEITSTAIARAAGVCAAKSPVVVFSEDHCFLASTWAEELIKRHREPWAGVGPLVQNANRSTSISWANFLIEYGEWVAFKSSCPVFHIAGNNGSYKRDVLLEHGTALARMLEASSPMQWAMAKKGHSFFIEVNAKAYHLNFSKFVDSLVHRFYVGRLFAYRRSHNWSILKKMLYCIGSPLIPLVRLFRILRSVIQIGKSNLIAKMFPILVVLLIFDGIGELVGYLTSKVGYAIHFVSNREFHHERFLIEKDKELLNDIDKLTSYQI